jgi:hypothetical protein
MIGAGLDRFLIAAGFEQGYNPHRDLRWAGVSLVLFLYTHEPGALKSGSASDRTTTGPQVPLKECFR